MERKEWPGHREGRKVRTGETEASNCTHKVRTALLFHLYQRNMKINNNGQSSKESNSHMHDKTTNEERTVTLIALVKTKYGKNCNSEAGFNSRFHYINVSLE